VCCFPGALEEQRRIVLKRFEPSCKLPTEVGKIARILGGIKLPFFSDYIDVALTAAKKGVSYADTAICAVAGFALPFQVKPWTNIR
jgi:hypothetical protein